MKRLREILVVDDEAGFGEMVQALLTREGYHVSYEPRARNALALLGSGAYDLVLCDVTMPELDGLGFLREFRARKLAPTIIMMSAYASVDTALECMKLGAYDYISKPFKPDELILTLKKVEEREGLRQENRALRKRLNTGPGFDHIIGRSEPMKRLFQIIAKIADYKSTVLLTGESGTGKEVVARAIHANSPRQREPFIAVNCGAIPGQLLESELFGHVRGAFTDANRDKKGVFDEAHGGTLFLDEIGEMPLALQVKLLRAIQEEEVRPVGAARPHRVDVRIVAATVRNLREDVQNKRFRDDLFYRLNVLPVHLPPLRDRVGDIPLLVEHFRERSAKRLHKIVREVTPDAMKLLATYAWPGNVRELENTLERAVVFCDDETVTVDVLPEQVLESADKVRLSLTSGELSIKKTTRIIEEELIRRALTKTGGNRTAASKLLEISHRTLLYKIKEYEVDIPPR